MVITSNLTSATHITEARNLAENPEGTTLYHHYDFEQKKLFYKTDFSDDFFGVVSDSDLTDIRTIHKQAIGNLLSQENQEVTADQILKNLVEINGLLSKVISKVRLPERLWNPDAEGYVHYPNPQGLNRPSTAGMVDGVLEEVTGTVLVASLAVGYLTDPEVKKQIDKSLEALEFTKVVNDFIAERKAIYKDSTTAKKEYYGGKDLVGVVSLATGVGAIIKGVKKGVTFTQELAKGVKRWGNEAVSLGNLAKRLEEFPNLEVSPKTKP